MVRVDPDGARRTALHRVNPGRPIPREATAIHGIGDDDVRDAPAFAALAPELSTLLEGADLAGFNVNRFDVPLLERELKDAGVDLGLRERRVIDVMTIFHRKEPRDLSAAVRFFLARDHAGAHGASADIEATLEVLDAQLAKYEDLPREVDALHRWLYPVPADAVDRQGKFVVREGEIVFAFGKLRGRPLKEVARLERDYLEWILRQDFPDDARALVERALRGEP